METSELSNVCPKCEGSGWYAVDGRRFLCPCQMNENRVIRRKYSGLPKYTRRPLLDITRDYIRRFDEIKRSETNWIMYCGRTGSGKSTQAFMIVDALLNRPIPVYAKVFNYPELARELSSLRFDVDRYETRLSNALEPDLIVLDDFLDVIPKQDTFEEQVALSIIKRRYVQQKPLVITTELTPIHFKNLMPRHGEAIFGRIYEMCNNRVFVANQDSQNYRFANSQTIEG